MRPADDAVSVALTGGNRLCVRLMSGDRAFSPRCPTPCSPAGHQFVLYQAVAA